VIEFPAGVGEVNGLALDGDRLLVGISAPCDSCEPELEYSAAIVSVGLDGSGPEVFASGIRAPISLATFGPRLGMRSVVAPCASATTALISSSDMQSV